MQLLAACMRTPTHTRLRVNVSVSVCVHSYITHPLGMVNLPYNVNAKGEGAGIE